jgi:hypothetical protein
MLKFLFPALLIISFAWPVLGADAEPYSVSGKPLVLGDIVLEPEQGWYRAPKSVEDEYEAQVLLYVANSGDEAKAEARYMLRFERELDRFASETEVARYLKNAEARLLRSGWSKGAIDLSGKKIDAYRRTNDESTTYLMLLPFKLATQTVYAVLPKASAGLPKSVATLLAGARLK